jgi:trehalose-6-phosphatase
MLQIGIEAFYERGTDFEDVCRECAEVADRINAKHIHASGSPVVLYKRVHTLDVVNRLALMSIADVFMNSAIRMGLNLKPFEYVFANERKGVLVLSEYNCAVVPLGGCLSTNPFNLNSSAQVLDMALSMPETERTARNGRDLEYVTTHATSNWALTVLLEMARISHRDDKAQYSYVGYGLGLCYRVLRIRADFQKLNFRKVQQAYKVSQRRLFLLDYGGTLLGGLGGHTWLSNASNKISAAQLQQLEALASDKRNLIFIVSGRSQAMMEATFASCPNVGLAAELGYYLKLPKCLHDSPEDAASSSEKGAAVEPGGSSADPPSLGRSQQQLQSGSFRRLPLEGWERVGGRHGHQIVDETWREVTVRIMEQYRKRTPGTRVEQKQSSVTWSFRDTDLEYGKMQAAELKTHLVSAALS